MPYIIEDRNTTTIVEFLSYIKCPYSRGRVWVNINHKGDEANI